MIVFGAHDEVEFNRILQEDNGTSFEYVGIAQQIDEVNASVQSIKLEQEYVDPLDYSGGQFVNHNASFSHSGEDNSFECAGATSLPHTSIESASHDQVTPYDDDSIEIIGTDPIPKPMNGTEDGLTKHENDPISGKLPYSTKVKELV